MTIWQIRLLRTGSEWWPVFGTGSIIDKKKWITVCESLLLIFWANGHLVGWNLFLLNSWTVLHKSKKSLRQKEVQDRQGGGLRVSLPFFVRLRAVWGTCGNRNPFQWRPWRHWPWPPNGTRCTRAAWIPNRHNGWSTCWHPPRRGRWDRCLDSCCLCGGKKKDVFCFWMVSTRQTLILPFLTAPSYLWKPIIEELIDVV